MCLGFLRWGRVFIASALLTVLMTWSVAALSVPAVPTDIPIVDQTNTLTDAQRSELATLIAESRTKTGNQIAILMVPSLEDEGLEEFSLDVARTWGIGSEEKDSGVLLFVAKNDRKLRIEVGYGLEGALTDIRSGRIIRDRITPEFRKGNYYEGIRAGVIGITTAIAGEVDQELSSSSQNEMPNIPIEFFIFAIFFVPIWMTSILARTKSWWAGGVIGGALGTIIAIIAGFTALTIFGIFGLFIGGLIFDKAVSKNYQKRSERGDSPSWWAGGTHFGGGGGSGGFGGFGGGGFGGGGASGSW